ncbi:hypothetical protein [Piscirickettsia salmonis]|uniref:hypothetical protein n=1 Tax=Piscirickettsia salmonis TaxID=1238 RepID=UPI003EB8DEAD
MYIPYMKERFNTFEPGSFAEIMAKIRSNSLTEVELFIKAIATKHNVYSDKDEVDEIRFDAACLAFQLGNLDLAKDLLKIIDPDCIQELAISSVRHQDNQDHSSKSVTDTLRMLKLLPANKSNSSLPFFREQQSTEQQKSADNDFSPAS